MKIAIILLSCFVAVALQQDVYWPSPVARYPYYYGDNDYIGQNYQPSYQRSGYIPKPYIQANENRFNVADDYEYPVSPRFFGLIGGGNNLLNSILSSLKATSTVFSTTISTVQANSVVTCYTSTMFLSSTACRRKRNIKDIISIGDINAEGPTKHEAVNGDIDQLPREGRDMNAAELIESSIQQESVSDSAPKSATFVRKERILVSSLLAGISTTIVTSTVTSFSLSYSTSTLTNTKLASSSALSCLPSGFTLC